MEKTNEFEEYLRWFKDLDKQKPKRQFLPPCTKPARKGEWDNWFNEYEGGKDNERV